jgi:putative ABC transport system ATP-binding protein
VTAAMDTAPEATAAARAVGLWKIYGTGEAQVVALRDLSVDIAAGKFTAIMGPSGSGKSTLMHCLAGLDTVSRGDVWIGATKVNGLSDWGLTRLRREKIGFIFQTFNLLPTLTAEENILLPLAIAGRKPDQAWQRAVVQAVGLEHRLRHRPPALSGGEQQRVACARAMITRPAVIFADEPTGNLDSRATAGILETLRDAVRDHGQTIVLVTHEPNAAAYADRVLFLADGQIVDEMTAPTAERVLDELKHLDTGSA